MQNPQGQIVSVCAGESGARAIVEVDSAVVCERCESGKGCGAGLLGRQPGDKRVEALVAENLSVQSGDLVSITLAPRNILRAAVIVYGYPLSGAVLAAVAAFGMGLGDVSGAISALVGLFAGILIAKVRLKNTRCLRDFTPTVVSRLSPVPD
jgi:sigma-E factor negative regulatory protein RseC